MVVVVVVGGGGDRGGTGSLFSRCWTATVSFWPSRILGFRALYRASSNLTVQGCVIQTLQPAYLPAYFF